MKDRVSLGMELWLDKKDIFQATFLKARIREGNKQAESESSTASYNLHKETAEART